MADIDNHANYISGPKARVAVTVSITRVRRMPMVITTSSITIQNVLHSLHMKVSVHTNNASDLLTQLYH